MNPVINFFYAYKKESFQEIKMQLRKQGMPRLQNQEETGEKKRMLRVLQISYIF